MMMTIGHDVANAVDDQDNTEMGRRPVMEVE